MVSAAIAIAGRVRLVALLLLPLSIAAAFNYHLTYWPGHLGVPAGVTIETVDLFLVLLLLLHAANPASRTDFRFYPSVIIPASLILLAGFFSLRNSSNATLTFYGLFDQGRAFALMLLLMNVVTGHRDIKMILLGLQLCGAVVGGLCIVEAAMETNFFADADKLEEQSIEGELFRSAGFLTPTYTGGLLASLIPLIIVQMWLFKSRLAQALTWFVLAICLFGLVLTLTRGAWLSLAVAAFFMLVGAAKIGVIARRHIVGSVVIFSLIAVFTLASQSKISARLDEGMGNVVARFALVETAWNMITENPLNGIGLNNYTIRIQEYEPASVIHSFSYIVHNKYLLTWSETGFLGLIAFIWLLAVSLIKSHEVYAISRRHSPSYSGARLNRFPSNQRDSYEHRGV